jgi:hypothetical protein
MRILRLIILTVFLIAIQTSEAQSASSSGQESWGGDTASLKFVKFGRILAFEMVHTPGCNLRKYFSARVLNGVIEKTNVESSDVTQPDRPGYIYLNRLQWWELPQNFKAEIALKKYAAQLGIALSEEQVSEAISLCSQSKLWAKNSNLEIPKDREPEVDVKKDLASLSSELLEAMKAGRIKAIPSGFRIDHFQELISRLRDVRSENGHTSVRLHPVYIRFPANMIKDAKNTVHGTKRDLVINRSVWKYLSRGQKKEFLFHELLGLMRIDDRTYHYSSLLIYDLPEEEYKS